MSHYGSWSLFGHCHGTLKDDPNLLSWDVGIDNNYFLPLEYKWIKARMLSKKEGKP
jgi:hypothetical protein